jgi:hypothetical protein
MAGNLQLRGCVSETLVSWCRERPDVTDMEWVIVI